MKFKQYKNNKTMGKPRSKSQKEHSRVAANERQDHSNTLSLDERIQRLDARLGKGVGAIKERKKIEALKLKESKKEKKSKKDKGV